MYPEAPTNLHVKQNNTANVKFCWTSVNPNGVRYSVHLKEVPDLVLKGDIS